MVDGRNLEEGYLYQLSQAKGLSWFKHMMLISSF